ncbi:MAG TPA: hypothetical protein VJQ82_28315 [Terriglobales bacterium]|nr:hypothetical protein [Terriglobales bacterium]
MLFSHSQKLVFSAFVSTFALAVLSQAADMKPEEVVAKHLDSIGTAQARAAAKSRVVEGTVAYTILVGGAGNLDGKSVLVSQNQKLQFMMKLNNNLYRGEQFIYDGHDYQIARTTANQQRSSFGEFVQVQNVVLKEGLFGGVLSTAWPLYDLDAHNVKLSYGGIKKIDGVDAIELRYSPKKSSDVEISLFFDQETFRHIETVYFVRQRAQLGNVNPLTSSTGLGPGPVGNSSDIGGPTTPVGGQTNETSTARQQESRYRLEEHFSDFKTADGLTLPNKYVIHYSQELGNGRTTVSEWTITANQVMNNASIDERNFQVK